MLVIDDVGVLPMERGAASAILDRLMYNGVVFNIKGPSWRLREHQALTTATTDPPNDDGANLTNREEPQPANANPADHRTRLSSIANGELKGFLEQLCRTRLGGLREFV